jgi:hypothetical protein
VASHTNFIALLNLVSELRDPLFVDEDGTLLDEAPGFATTGGQFGGDEDAVERLGFVDDELGHLVRGLLALDG